MFQCYWVWGAGQTVEVVQYNRWQRIPIEEVINTLDIKMSRLNEMKQSNGKCGKIERESSRTAAMASIAAAGYIFVFDNSSHYPS